MSIVADLFESWSERVKLRIFIGILVLLIASTVSSCNEMRYFVWGKTIDAKYEKGEVFTRGSGGKKLTIYYSFDDGDLGTRKEDDEVDLDWLKGRDIVDGAAGTVTVQYIPGTAERSRLKGHNYIWLTIPFGICVIAAGVFGLNFWNEFQDHERRSKAASALYKR
jgi:hypothetical protein